MGYQTNNLLNLIPVNCFICGNDKCVPVGTGKDFEYNSSSDTFIAYKCLACNLVYLNPRPDISEFDKIYPANYHAFDFSETKFGIVYKVRQQLETKRLLNFSKDLEENARVLDIGCGDGFHLKLLAKYGKKSWQLEGIDINKRAVEMAERSKLNVRQGTIETLNLPENFYDLVLMIQTIEHLAKPDEMLLNIKKILKPGGQLVIVTDNTDSLDFTFFKSRYWGGYHFPRHWNLFNKIAINKLAAKTGFEIVSLTTQCSPVNWVYTIHNWLVDKKASKWLINKFTLSSTFSLSIFTILDAVLQKFRRGALLRVKMRKPL
jgi:2-polyprenyl-3-methyl-5-hydroxy-6-metoxy-1,4-benzoquinol methylase